MYLVGNFHNLLNTLVGAHFGILQYGDFGKLGRCRLLTDAQYLSNKLA